MNPSKRPEVPAGTVFSANFVKTPNNTFKLKMFDANGRPVDFKELMKSKKSGITSKVKLDNNQVLLTFKNGSCIVEVCMPGIPCFPVLVDPVNNCPNF